MTLVVAKKKVVNGDRVPCDRDEILETETTDDGRLVVWYAKKTAPKA